MTSAGDAFPGAGVWQPIQVINDPLLFKNLQVGQTSSSGSFRIEARAMKSFATDFDPQPLHLYEVWAAASFFAGPFASKGQVAVSKCDAS
ncbi:hypothetical protein DYI37_17375 [Fulvimarina endophytica]|uniref:Uncharacterized protein n=1 Tax=Fulvimarina endophytica TaxID=2293836 RepID=A0A371WZ59_9HYPH|nr:hypothetical protein [Fulvimarina endophytica]RFC62275.1 hypothetical protein DYI37_17375 [Fulvimarina endophytica]